MIGSLIYSLARVLLDLLATSHGDQAKLQAEVLVLRRQVQVLERQIKRVRWTHGDRMVLAALRQRIPQSAWAGLLVKPETVLGWHRALVHRKWAAYRDRPRRGRPPTSAERRQLILRMAHENPNWGYFRIRGELLRFGHSVAATTIRSVLLSAGTPPAGRRSRLTWKQFLAAHADTLLAADFFSVDTIFFQRLYVLIYVHLASRRVLAARCTAEPAQAWVTQQSRNLSWKLAEAERCESRSGQEIRSQGRRRIQVRRRSNDLDSTHSAEGERPRRALDRKLPSRVPGLDADRESATSGSSPA